MRRKEQTTSRVAEAEAAAARELECEAIEGGGKAMLQSPISLNSIHSRFQVRGILSRPGGELRTREGECKRSEW